MPEAKQKTNVSMSILLCWSLCVIGTLSAFFIKLCDSRTELNELFTKVAEQQVIMFQEHMEHNLSDALSLRMFFQGSTHVDLDEFDVFIQPIIQKDNGLEALVWIPRVAAKSRNDFEKEIRSNGYDSFTFKTLSKENLYQKEFRKDVYYPVYFYDKHQSSPNFWGLNLGSFPKKASLFEHILTTGQPCMSDSITIDGHKVEPGTHCIYMPVFTPHEDISTVQGRRQHLKGFVGAYLDLEKFLKSTVISSTHDIHVSYSNFPQIHEIHAQSIGLNYTIKLQDLLGIGELSFHAKIPIEDKYVCLNISPGEHFIAQYFSQGHWAILLVGGVISVLIRMYLSILLNRNKKTEQLVHERTEELKQEKELSVEMAIQAKAASQAKSDFLSNMSHEMRTPLNSIIGFGDLLCLEKNFNEEQKDFLDTIMLNARHLLQLINDILDLSRIESGNTKTIQSGIDPTKQIHEAIKSLTVLVKEKNLKLITDIQSDLPEHIMLNGNYFGQCMINLIGNAVKFTDHGSITISANIITNNRGHQLRIEVKDTGIGIPPEKLNDIFESFSQVDNSATRKYQGSGLGLTITKRFVELMGGYITVESTLNKGTTFTVLLPVQLPVTVSL